MLLELDLCSPSAVRLSTLSETVLSAAFETLLSDKFRVDVAVTEESGDVSCSWDSDTVGIVVAYEAGSIFDLKKRTLIKNISHEF